MAGWAVAGLRWRLASLMITAMMIFVAFPAQACLPGPEPPPFTRAIFIGSNSQFTRERGVESGSGTPEDPYVIEGGRIDTAERSGISIWDTTAHFVIRNWVLTDPSKLESRGSCCAAGVSIFSAHNGRIENVTVLNHDFGVEIAYSSDITVAGSRIENSYDGIYLRESERVTLDGNTLTNNSIRISAETLARANSHSISSSNTVDGRPFEYHRDCADTTYENREVGGFTVANCARVTISNVTVRQGFRGFQALWSQDITIKDSTGFGVEAIYAQRIIVAHSAFAALAFHHSEAIDVEGNQLCSNQSHVGVLGRAVSNVHIAHNTICNQQGNAISIGDYHPDVFPAANISIQDNTAFNINRTAIEVVYGVNVEIVGNRLSSNGNGINLFSTEGGRVAGNEVNHSGSAITVGGKDLTLEGNVLEDNEDGISVSTLDATLVRDNSFRRNQYGLILQEAPNAIVHGNHFEGDGIWLQGMKPADYDALEIAANNTVNGKPILFHHDETGVVVDGADVGQLIVASCENVTVANVSIANTSEAMLFYRTQNLSLENVLIENSTSGIILNSVYVASIGNSTLRSTGGIYTYDVVLLGLYNNTLQNNTGGVMLAGAGLISLADNRIENSGQYGLALYGAYNVSMERNAFVNNSIVLRPQGVDEVLSNSIGESNTVNDKPIIYTTQCGPVQNAALGQLIVAGCAGFRGANLTIAGGDVGAAVAFATDVRLDHVVVTGARSNGIEIQASTNVTVTNATVSGTGNRYWEYSGYGIHAWDSEEVTVASSAAFDNEFVGIGAELSFEVVFESNVVERNSVGIVVDNSAGGRVEGNTARQNGGGISVSASAFRVAGNRVEGNAATGLWVAGRDVVVENNTAIDNPDQGIVIRNAGSILVVNNTATGNGHGIVVWPSNGPLNVSHNEIARNEVGIRIEFRVEGTLFTDNNVTDNGIGVRVSGTSGAEFYGNRFVNNTHQVVNDGQNTWDRGYPEGGNYWSDYNGTDDCSGESQDVCGDPDGIGDTPYCSGAPDSSRPEVDHYPWATPNAPPERPPVPAKPTVNTAPVLTIEAGLLLLILTVAAGVAIVFWLQRRKPIERLEDEEIERLS